MLQYYQSLQVSSQIVDDIIHNTHIQIADNQWIKQITIKTADETIDLASNQANVVHTQISNIDSIDEDLEPIQKQNENMAPYRVKLQKHLHRIEGIEVLETFQDDLIVITQSDQQSVEQEYAPKLIMSKVPMKKTKDLWKIALEDSFRLKKSNVIFQNLRDQKEIEENKIAEIKRMQEYQNGIRELGNQSYTYDFDGKIMIQRPLKLGKLYKETNYGIDTFRNKLVDFSHQTERAVSRLYQSEQQRLQSFNNDGSRQQNNVPIINLSLGVSIKEVNDEGQEIFRENLSHIKPLKRLNLNNFNELCMTDQSGLIDFLQDYHSNTSNREILIPSMKTKNQKKTPLDISITSNYSVLDSSVASEILSLPPIGRIKRIDMHKNRERFHSTDKKDFILDSIKMQSRIMVTTDRISQRLSRSRQVYYKSTHQTTALKQEIISILNDNLLQNVFKY